VITTKSSEMKSNKQRRAELKAKRAKRALELALLDPREINYSELSGVLPADMSKLGHNTTAGALPTYYMDRAFTCRDCNGQEIWTAKQQKWWYEEAKGNIYSCAVRCRACRLLKREQFASQPEPARRLHDECELLRQLAWIQSGKG
jgi:Probable zinc-ribbon domain